MASNRIDNGISAMRSAGFAVLARRVEGKIKTEAKYRRARTQIESALSLGGFRGVIRKIKSSSKTDRRALARGVILAWHVIQGDSIARLKGVYKDKSEAELKQALKQLDTSTGQAAVAAVSRPVLASMVSGKAYRYLKQQTHTGSSTTNADLARARGWVPQTKNGVATGKFVPVDGGDSCGPTALAIAYLYSKGKNMSEEEFRGLSQRDGDGWQTHGVGSGTNSMQSLVRTGRKVGMTCGNARQVPANNAAIKSWLTQNLGQRKVALLNVGWHFSVAVAIENDTLICADPWFGIVQTPMDKLPEYNAKGKRINGWMFSVS